MKIAFCALTVLAIVLPVRADDGVLAGLEKEIREIVDQAGPAVVTVTVELPGSRAASPANPAGSGDPPPLLVRTSRVGSGFLYSADGLVLTSSEVAEGGGRATVEFPGGATREGKILGTDRFFQVAVVKVDPVPGVEPLSFVPDGSARVPSVGILLGNAYDQSRDISFGILTAIHQSGPSSRPFDNYEVVNASTRAGDTGGPFLDSKGRVVGMAVSPHPPRLGMFLGNRNGHGVSIHGLPVGGGTTRLVPASDLRFAASEIVAYGRVRRGFLGVGLKASGLDVLEVKPGSPAEKAGIAVGDVIRKIGGEPVRDGRDFGFYLRRTPVGTPFALTLDRAGTPVTVTPSLEEVTPGREPLFSSISVRIVKGRLVVISVGGRLAKAGVQTGDVLLKVNGAEVKSGEALLRRVVALKGSEPVTLDLERNGQAIQLVVPD